MHRLLLSGQSLDCASTLHWAVGLSWCQRLGCELHVRVQDLVQQLGKSSGCAATPSAVSTILISAACRYAIMFGDELTPDAARQLVADLAQTRLCGVCAHGRPTVAPLLDLSVTYA